MARALQILFVATCFAILVLPGFATVRPFFHQEPVVGVVEPASVPPLSLASASDEAFQRGFTNWFEQRYGLRPTATRIDGSIAYWLFGESPPDKSVHVGTRDVLFIDEQLGIYNHNGSGVNDAAIFATTFARAQKVMLERGQVLLYIIVPTKSSVWPDVPRSWSLPLGEPRPFVTKLTDPAVAELTRAGVRFVDGRRTLATLMRDRPDAVYAKSARHASSPAMCLLLDEAFAMARPLLTGWTIPPFDCSFTMSDSAPLESVDYDLYRLLNIWPSRPRTPIPLVPELPERVPRSQRPNLFVAGSSFGWTILSEAKRNHAVGRTWFHYYMETLLDFEVHGEARVKMGTKPWLDAISASPLIVMPVPEEYLSRSVDELAVPLLRAFDPEYRDGGAPP